MHPQCWCPAVHQFLDQIPHEWHAGCATDQQDSIDILRVHLGIAKRLFYERGTALRERCGEGGKLRPRQRHVEVERTVGANNEMGELEGSLHDTGKLTLGALRSLAEPVQGLTVRLQVDPVLSQQNLADVVNQAVIKIVAAKTEVSNAGSHLTDASTYLGEGDLAGLTANVNHHNRCALLRFQRVH